MGSGNILQFFEKIEKGHFISRPNRFTLICERRGEKITAFLPNPGRLRELLFPGASLFLEKCSVETRKTQYTAVAVERDGIPIMLHTHRTNDVAEYLFSRNLIPHLAGSRVKKREVRVGKSRFDFLLEQGNRDITVEVKSCTLFGSKVAMFPDAVTARGRKHVEELVSLRKRGKECTLIFIVQWLKAECFSPDYHTDLAFSKSLLAGKDFLPIIPVAVEWHNDLTLGTKVKILDIPWNVIEREAKDHGSYILVFHLREDKTIPVGKKGNIFFEKGFYLYVGSGKKNLQARLNRHIRKSKKIFWHVDYFSKQCEPIANLPVRTADDIECKIAVSLRGVYGEGIEAFGSSDCSCHSHLFRTDTNPLESRAFQNLLLYFRMDRIYT